MAKTINVKNLILRNDTSENWSTANPVLQLGELGIDTTEKKIKIGDGTTPWNELDFSSSKGAELGTAAPTAADDEFDVGTIWVNTTNDLAYLLYDNTADAAVWKQIVTPDQLEELGAGDMLKAVYATNDKSSQGYVDKAVLADTATNATSAESAAKLSGARNINLTGDATGSASFNGSADADIAVTISNETIAGKAPAFVVAGDRANIATGETIAVMLGKIAKFFTDLKGLAFKDKVAMADFNTDVTEKFSSIDTAIAGKQDAITVDANKALISNGEGKVAASTVTATELSYLSGVTGGIQAQLDNIPKYVYLDGIEISIADDSEQAAITEAAQTALADEYPEAVKWNAVTVNVTFTPSDVEIDELFYFNGTSWVYLNKVSTGVQRANGTTAGIVENSADVTFVDGQATVVQAGKVKNALTAGGKTFNGSAPVTIEASDLGALTAIPEEYVKETEFATVEKGGVVKSSVANNKVTVEADGTMTVNTIDASKISGAVAEASKLTNALTIQKNGKPVDTFDGSVAKTVNIEVPTASTQLSDTAHILYDTDEIAINCGGAAQE